MDKPYSGKTNITSQSNRKIHPQQITLFFLFTLSGRYIRSNKYPPIPQDPSKLDSF